MITTKICTTCKEEKLLEMFSLQREGRFGRNSKCKACKGKREKERYETNVELAREKARERTQQYRLRHPERNRELVAKRRQQQREFIAARKAELGCGRCGINDHRVLDFHHKDPNEKELAVSQLLSRKGWEAVLNEMEKCIVLCANCHRITHAELASSDVTAQIATAGFFRAQ